MRPVFGRQLAFERSCWRRATLQPKACSTAQQGAIPLRITQAIGSSTQRPASLQQVPKQRCTIGAQLSQACRCSSSQEIGQHTYAAAIQPQGASLCTRRLPPPSSILQPQISSITSQTSGSAPFGSSPSPSNLTSAKDIPGTERKSERSIAHDIATIPNFFSTPG